jgi:transcriptional regulator with XRE-family HTH domain
METPHAFSEAQQARVLGTRLAQIRIRRQMTQEELANRAGLGLRTVQRLEMGEASTQLVGFLKVCGALGLSDRLEVLVPEQRESPIEQLRLAASQRRRVRAPRAVPPEAGWTWGETR